MYFSAAHFRHASVTNIFFNSKYSYSMMPKLDRMNVYCLYPCEGILKKSELWQHSDPGWPKEGDNLKFEPCICILVLPNRAESLITCLSKFPFLNKAFFLVCGYRVIFQEKILDNSGKKCIFAFGCASRKIIKSWIIFNNPACGKLMKVLSLEY